MRKEKSCWCQDGRKENFKTNGWFPSYNFSLVQQVYATVWSLFNTLYLSGLACSTTHHLDTRPPPALSGLDGMGTSMWEQQCWGSGWPFLYATRSYLVLNTTQHRQHATEQYKEMLETRAHSHQVGGKGGTLNTNRQLEYYHVYLLISKMNLK